MQGHRDEILNEREVITPLKDVVVSCDECRRELLQFVVSPEKITPKRGCPTEIKWKVKCSKCNSHSFLYKFSTKVYISPMEDTFIINMENDIIEIGY
jgi:hypothetical protein